MTRKDFELIARTLKEGMQSIELHAHVRLCESFADELARTNSRFDRSRFLTACGVE